MALRPYQADDVDASWEALRKHESVLYPAATGLGKSVVMAAVARHVTDEGGRVLVLSDRRVLTEQLAKTFSEWTGAEVGIEQAERSSDGWLGPKPLVVIAMIQTLYSGGEGTERFRQWRPDEFDLIIVDEAEAFVAPSYREPIEYFREGGARVWGCTATPMRTDGQSLGIIFAYDLPARDIRWAIKQGYLVPARSADVEVELDKSILRKNKEGDYSDASVARMIAAMAEREEDARAFARGVLEINQGKRGILVTPKVDIARQIADYLNVEKEGTAGVIYGEMMDEAKEEIFNQHRRGGFPILSSCDMLTKGYDDPELEQVFICRPTRSRRLFIQVVGRGLRLLDPAIGALPDADARKQAIAESAKPHALVACMVPLDADTRDMTVADALTGDLTPEARETIRERQADQPDADTLDLLEAVQHEIAEDKADRERKMRDRILVQGKVSTTYSDVLDHSVGSVSHSDRSSGGISSRQLEILAKGGVSESEIKRMTKGQAGRVAARIIKGWNEDLASYKQAKKLMQSGYGREEVATMSFDEASERMGVLAQNGWRIKRDQIENELVSA